MVAPAVLFFLMMSLPESPRWHLLKARLLEEQKPPADRLKIEEQYEHAFYALRTLRHTKIQAARDLFYIDSWLRLEELPETPHNPSEDRTDIDHGAKRRGTWFPYTQALYRQPRCRRAMAAGLIVMSLQQLCGINVLAYYSSSVFKDSLLNSTMLAEIGNTQNMTLQDQWIKIENEKDNVALKVGLAGKESLR